LEQSEISAEIWTRTNCPACTNAKRFLDSKNIKWTEKKLNSQANQKKFAMKTRGAKTVPQIFIGGTLIGGFDSLLTYEKRGDLDRILGRQSEKRGFFSWFLGR